MKGPVGPIRVNANRQIALPKALTDQMGLGPDSYVYVMRSDREPAGLLIVPQETVDEWIQAGRGSERR